MSRKLTCFCVFVLFVCAGITHADLVAHWNLDDGSGDVACGGDNSRKLAEWNVARGAILKPIIGLAMIQKFHCPGNAPIDVIKEVSNEADCYSNDEEFAFYLSSLEEDIVPARTALLSVTFTSR